jgi:hypothetical protein
MPIYKAVKNAAVKGRFVREGAIVELNEDKAKPYLDAGLIVAIADSAQKQEGDAQKGKGKK